jgi:hypothetical protein
VERDRETRFLQEGVEGFSVEYVMMQGAHFGIPLRAENEFLPATHPRVHPQIVVRKDLGNVSEVALLHPGVKVVKKMSDRGYGSGVIKRDRRVGYHHHERPVAPEDPFPLVKGTERICEVFDDV